MSECLIYQIKPGKTMVCTSAVHTVEVYIEAFFFQVGCMDSKKAAAIRLSGNNILEEHCYFENNEGKVVIQSLPDSVTVRSIQNVQITCHLPVESS